jgi:hypothetical protein
MGADYESGLGNMQNSRLSKKDPKIPEGIRLPKGALASKRGKNMSFAQIRQAAANAARIRRSTR